MKYYFTFMQSQWRLKDFYLCVEGTYSEARDKVFQVISDKWAFQYSEEEWTTTKHFFKEEISLEKAKEFLCLKG